MILKMLTHERDVHYDEWNWYDNIEAVTVYYDVRVGNTVISVKFTNKTEAINLVLKDVAYLCNDKGQTIEVLHGKREVGQTNPNCKLTRGGTNSLCESK